MNLNNLGSGRKFIKQLLEQNKLKVLGSVNTNNINKKNNPPVNGNTQK